MINMRTGFMGTEISERNLVEVGNCQHALPTSYAENEKPVYYKHLDSEEREPCQSSATTMPISPSSTAIFKL